MNMNDYDDQNISYSLPKYHKETDICNGDVMCLLWSEYYTV
jgi:hypothetical protein